MDEDFELTLDLIAPLGGTEKDLKLLQSSSKSHPDRVVISHQEVVQFIDSIGLDGVVVEEGIEVKKSKKTSNKTAVGPSKTDVVPSPESKPPAKKEKSPAKKENKKFNKKQQESSCIPSSEEKVLTNDVLKSIKGKQHKKLLFGSGTMEGSWFDQAKSTGEVATPVSPDVLEHLHSVGAELMEREASLYEEVRNTKKKSDSEWLRNVLTSGTIADKLSARTLLIQESPLHHLGAIDALLAMAKKKSKREAILAVDTLQDLWLNLLLPSDRKLKLLAQQPLQRLTQCSSINRDKTLMCWYFEDQLKERYSSYITVLQLLSHDTVMNIRSKIVGNVYDLLVQKPEQEQKLLTQLVNKLGDPERKIASRTAFFLLKLVGQHPRMQLIVLKEIEQLMRRPNIQSKAQYYGVCCINQFVLSSDNQELVEHLVKVYFVFFQAYIKEGQLDAKMLSALLTGINRAFPFIKSELKSYEEHLNTLFKVVHISPIATSIQSLMLLYQVMESRQEVSDRFYRALYTKLLNPDLKHSKGQAMFLNVLFKSLKCDPALSRIKAFLKRILQVCSTHQPPFICGCLFLISEILKLKSSLWPFVGEAEGEEEHFKDVPFEEEAVQTEEDNDENADDFQEEKLKDSKKVLYLPTARNPLYCKAEHSCLWELAMLTQHYHPSVRTFAATLTQGDHITYKGDPLQDFTAVKFLDKFVYKNPKQKQSDHGGSIMQPTPKYSRKEFPLNSEEFVKLKENDVREDEMFFYKYFISKVSLRSLSKKIPDEDLIGGDLNEQMDDSLGLDFARELDQKKKQPRKKRRKQQESDDSESEDNDEYSYDDMDDDVMSEESFTESGAPAKEPTDAEYEKMLFENLTSEESDDELETAKPKKKKSRTKMGSIFDASTMLADADEFAHLLDDSGEGAAMPHLGRKNPSHKQLAWEENKSKGKWQKKKGPFKAGYRAKSNDKNKKRKK